MKTFCQKWVVPVLLSLLVFALQAQQPTHEVKPALTRAEKSQLARNPGARHSKIQGVPLAGEANPLLARQLTPEDLLNDRLTEGLEEEDPELDEAKESQEEAKLRETLAIKNVPDPFAPSKNAPDAITPVLKSSFNATQIGSGNPPDNTMAISNGGYIVTCVNSRVGIYNTAGTNLGNWLLSSFFNFSGSGVVNDFFDPVIIYDSGADRFVATCVVGRNPTNSRVMVGFSKTNNPLNGWWIYFLPGNILNNNCWFDYPKMGYSTNEVYISGNLFTTTPTFNQAIFFQIPKAAGYAGQSLNYQYWYNIQGAPQTLVPLSYGGWGSYGPGVYLVSHDRISSSATKFYTLTNDMSASNEQLLYSSVTVPSYTIGANAYQKNTTERLDVGDSRIQSGFYKDGIAHYAFHAKATSSTSYNGIHYHRISVGPKTATSQVVWSTNYDLVYPAVAWGGTGTGKDVVIYFQYSSSAAFPGVGGVSIDNANVISPNWMYCAQGAGFVNQNNSNNQAVSRWGDYLGICRKQNATPLRIWGGGSFGNTSSNYTCKIFESGLPNGPADGPRMRPEESGVEMPQVSLFPNPATSASAYVAVHVPKAGQVRSEVYDLLGALVSRPFDQSAVPGLNHYQFPTHQLLAGTYIVKTYLDNQLISNEELVVLR